MLNALTKKYVRSILTYTHVSQRIKAKFLTHYRLLCEWFGIHDNISDQIWYLGTFVISIALLTIITITYLISSLY